MNISIKSICYLVTIIYYEIAHLRTTDRPIHPTRLNLRILRRLFSHYHFQRSRKVFIASSTINGIFYLIKVQTLIFIHEQFIQWSHSAFELELHQSKFLRKFNKMADPKWRWKNVLSWMADYIFYNLYDRLSPKWSYFEICSHWIKFCVFEWTSASKLGAALANNSHCFSIQT